MPRGRPRGMARGRGWLMSHLLWPGGRGYIEGFVYTSTGTWTATLGAGAARAQSGTFDIVTTGTLNLDVNSTGPGGRRSGLATSVNLNLWVFVIADSSRVNPTAAFADNSTTPSLPAGYDQFVLVYRTRVNAGNSGLLVVYQVGSGRDAIWSCESVVVGNKTGTFGTPSSVSMSLLTAGNLTRHPAVFVKPSHVSAAGTDSCSVRAGNTTAFPLLAYTASAVQANALWQAGAWCRLITDELFIDRASTNATGVFINGTHSMIVRGAL